MGILDNSSQVPVRAPSEREVRVIAFSFTTESDGTDPKLNYDYEGQLTIAKALATDTYTVGGIGSFKRILSCVASCSIEEFIALQSSGDGYVALLSTDTLVSARVDVILTVEI